MDMQPERHQDEIDRAMCRNSVRCGSPLEADVRAKFYFIVGVGETDREQKLDAYIASQKGSAFYSGSFTPSRPECPGRLDTMTLTPEEFDAIADGSVRFE
jgi:hypothetical protein